MKPGNLPDQDANRWSRRLPASSGLRSYHNTISSSHAHTVCETWTSRLHFRHCQKLHASPFGGFYGNTQWRVARLRGTRCCTSSSAVKTLCGSFSRFWIFLVWVHRNTQIEVNKGGMRAGSFSLPPQEVFSLTSNSVFGLQEMLFDH